MKRPQDRMRGVAWDYKIGAIEFGDEPAQFFRKVIYENLPRSKQCGMSAKMQSENKTFHSVSRG